MATISSVVVFQAAVKIRMVKTAHAPGVPQVELHAILILIKEQSIAWFLSDIFNLAH
jgi:hypothetical protein